MTLTGCTCWEGMTPCGNLTDNDSGICDECEHGNHAEHVEEATR